MTLSVPLRLVFLKCDAALPGVVPLKFHGCVRWYPWGCVGWRDHETCDGSMEVVNIREGASRATDVMSWTGHVLREETDGVFDRGLRITLVVPQSVSFTYVLWGSRCCEVPGERYCAVV